MQRRTLIKVGVAGGLVLAAAGALVAVVAPARREGRFTPEARAMLDALARAILAGVLPTAAAEERRALDGLVQRLQDTVQGLPLHLQAELDELFTLLASPPGRRALMGLPTPWAQASSAEVAAALEAMRHSSLALRQQAYQGLRNLTNAAYFADRSTWAVLGYPGQRPVPNLPAPR